MASLPHSWNLGDLLGSHNVNSCKFIYLFFGELRPSKGLEILIDTFAASCDLKREVLVIAGCPLNAAYGRDLLARARSSEGIYVHPFFIPDAEVPMYFGAANVVVLPYRDVLTSGATLLAHSLARAVVAPATGCLPKLLEDGRGWLYDPNQPLSLRDAMRAASSGDYVDAGKRCRDSVKHLTWESVASATREIYAKILGDEEMAKLG
jgi:beta-1,4-mannosyltransferase